MIRQGRSQKTQAEDIIYPVNGVREEMKRRGVQPKDYHKDNLKDLKKKKEEFIKKQKELEESKKQSSWKLNKFKNIESLALKDKKQVEEIKKAKAKKSVEEREKTHLQESKEKDYVKGNAAKAQGTPVKKPTEKLQENVYSLNPHFGKVPKYLQNIKEEQFLQREELKRQALEEKLPPGTRLLTEEERLETLRNLQESKKEVEKAIGKMPISMRTLALQQKKVELEKKIEELDTAIATFSRPKVYIAIE